MVSFAFEDSPVTTAEVPGGQDVLICVNLISGILTMPLDVLLRPSSGVGFGGAIGNDDIIQLGSFIKG